MLVSKNNAKYIIKLSGILGNKLLSPIRLKASIVKKIQYKLKQILYKTQLLTINTPLFAYIFEIPYICIVWKEKHSNPVYSRKQLNQITWITGCICMRKPYSE